GISIYALGKSQLKKIRAAMASGIFQLTLACLVIADVVYRLMVGSKPQSILIMGIGAIALVANICCLWLISQHRQGEIHLRASWIFSRNDVIANLGVILAGLLVNLFSSRFPDLIIGIAITLLVFLGGLEIIRDAYRERVKLRRGMQL
ncbi:MAG: cation transporter, partial [Cyanobacteria bacterium P01_A01_bin.40]